MFPFANLDATRSKDIATDLENAFASWDIMEINAINAFLCRVANMGSAGTASNVNVERVGKVYSVRNLCVERTVIQLVDIVTLQENVNAA